MVKQTSNHVIYVIIFFINCGFKVHGTNTIDCDFEDGWCNWIQDDNDDFNWKRISGNTPTRNTGPNADHTTGDGFYVYIDTSEVRRNIKAKLDSPTLNPGTYCFSMWYYMYGLHVDRLTVSKIESKTEQKLYEVSGNQDQKWILAQRNFTATARFMIVIEGTVIDSNRHNRGDIAIDDKVMFSGECPKECGSPVPAFGTANSTNFTIGSVVQIACKAGNEITVTFSIKCLINGTWSDKPECKSIDCGTRKISNGQFRTISGTKFGQTARQHCNVGYRLSGDEIVTCTEAGWNGTEAGCSIVYCGERKIKNGKFTTTSGTVFGKIAEQSCNTGYTFAGDKKVICTESGWNGTEATCTFVDCGERKIKNGKFTITSGTVFGKIAEQSCNTSYTFTGDKKVICTESGWNGTEATCSIVDSGNTSVLIAVYVLVSVVAVAVTIGLLAVIWRKCISGGDKKDQAIKEFQYSDLIRPADVNAMQSNPGSTYTDLIRPADVSTTPFNPGSTYTGLNNTAGANVMYSNQAMPQEHEYTKIDGNEKKTDEKSLYYNTVETIIS